MTIFDTLDQKLEVLLSTLSWHPTPRSIWNGLPPRPHHPHPIHQYVLPTHLYWIFSPPPIIQNFEDSRLISNYGYSLLMISGIPWLLSGSRLVLQTEASCGILQPSRLVFRKDFSKKQMQKLTPQDR